MVIYMISNLYMGRAAANCIQSRAMRDAFSHSFEVRWLFKDNSNFFIRCCFAITQAFTENIVFTRSYIIALACRLFGVKCIYELHELHPRRAYWMLGGRSNLMVVCISSSLERLLRQRSGNVNLRTFVSHDGCDTEAILKARSSRPLQSLEALKTSLRKNVLLHTGSTYKFDSGRIGEVASKLPDDWIFVQMGDVPSSVRALYKNTPNVYFLPSHTHNESLVAQRQADCLLYLNFPESRMYEVTSPLKLFEYIMSGTPFIATRGGATDEVLDNIPTYAEYKNMSEYLKTFDFDREAKVHSMQAKALGSSFSWVSRANNIIESFS